jgi:hypothetical protein
MFTIQSMVLYCCENHCQAATRCSECINPLPSPRHIDVDMKNGHKCDGFRGQSFFVTVGSAEFSEGVVKLLPLF